MEVLSRTSLEVLMRGWALGVLGVLGVLSFQTPCKASVYAG